MSNNLLSETNAWSVLKPVRCQGFFDRSSNTRWCDTGLQTLKLEVVTFVFSACACADHIHVFFCGEMTHHNANKNMILTSPCCPSRQMVPSMFIFVYVKPCHGKVSCQLATYLKRNCCKFASNILSMKVSTVSTSSTPWWESLPNKLISIQLGWQYEVLGMCVSMLFFNAIALLPPTSSTGPQPPSPRSHLPSTLRK